MKHLIVNLMAIIIIGIGGFNLMQAQPVQAATSVQESCTTTIAGHAITITGNHCHHTSGGGCKCTN